MAERLECSSETVSLVCPLSHMRIVAAAKGRLCCHTGCFDHSTFVSLRCTRCPVCNVAITADDLVYDATFMGYLRQFPQLSSIQLTDGHGAVPALALALAPAPVQGHTARQPAFPSAAVDFPSSCAVDDLTCDDDDDDDDGKEDGKALRTGRKDAHGSDSRKKPRLSDTAGLPGHTPISLLSPSPLAAARAAATGRPPPPPPPLPPAASSDSRGGAGDAGHVRVGAGARSRAGSPDVKPRIALPLSPVACAPAACAPAVWRAGGVQEQQQQHQQHQHDLTGAAALLSNILEEIQQQQHQQHQHQHSVSIASPSSCMAPQSASSAYKAAAADTAAAAAGPLAGSAPKQLRPCLLRAHLVTARVLLGGCEVLFPFDAVMAPQRSLMGTCGLCTVLLPPAQPSASPSK
jgi:hypothetical protein